MKAFSFTLLARHTQKTTVVLLIAAFSLFFLSGCKPGWEPNESDGSSSSSSSSSEGSTQTYQGPGSSWELELNTTASTFTFNRSPTPEADTNLEINGSYQALDTGFTQLTVGGFSPIGVGVENNEVITGITIGDTLMVFIPFASGSDFPIVLSRATNCSNGISSSNWLLYKPASTLNSDEHVTGHFGNFTYDTVGDDEIKIQSQYALDNALEPVDGIELATGSCNDNLLTAGNTRTWFSSDSSAIVEIATDESALTSGDSTNSQYIVSLDSGEISATSEFDSEDYVGILYDSQYGDGNRSIPVSGSCSSGTCTLNRVTEIEIGTTDPYEYTLDLSSTDDASINNPVDGFIIGTLSEQDGGSATISCTVNDDYQDSGDTFIACVGISPNATDSSQLANIFLVDVN